MHLIHYTDILIYSSVLLILEAIQWIDILVTQVSKLIPMMLNVCDTATEFFGRSWM